MYYVNVDVNCKIFKVHNIPDFNGENIHLNSKNKFKQIYNCLTDMYYILKSDYFIPSYNSGLSKWLIQMILSKSKKSNNIFNIKSKAKIVLSKSKKYKNIFNIKSKTKIV